MSAETEITLSYKLGEFYKYKADCLSNVLHCYSIHFKLCYFCFESATPSKSYCIEIIFLKLLFYRLIIIAKEIIRRIECLGAINLGLIQRIMKFEGELMFQFTYSYILFCIVFLNLDNDLLF